MTREESDVVAALRLELIERIGTERFELWFKSGVRIAIDARALLVAAANAFVLERLKKQFLSDLQAIARTRLGETAAVDFSVDASLQAQPATTSPRQVANDGAGAGNRSEAPQQRLENSTAALPDESTTPFTAADYKRSGRRFASLATYVVGSGNRVAHAAAHSVADRPGLVTPLFYYGATGCGKTHLLEGIYSLTRKQHGSSRVLFLSAEQFTSYFLDALRNGGLPIFRRRTREVDLLVIDDLQFFAGKRATMIELKHTIDVLIREGRQLVLAADRPPVALTEFGSEFTARVTGGLVCGIDDADLDTRLGIARGLAARGRVAIPDDVLDLVCNELPGDGRQIAGALNRLEATSMALRMPITVELARNALQDIFQATHRVVRLPDIERAVCGAFGLTPKLLRTDCRSRAASHPRMLAMWLARKYTQAASSEISHFFGRRSHSTVISAERKVNGWVTDGATVNIGSGACKVTDAIRRAELHLRSS